MSNGSKFNVGDLVILMSGGPTMTVTQGPNGDELGVPKYGCTWFGQDQSFHSMEFPEGALGATSNSSKAGK